VAALRAKDGTEYPLAPQPHRWLVGSGANCDLVLDDPYVSATHCILERRIGGALMVRDRRSRNGTLIDGNAVEAAELPVGARLVVGRTTLVAIAAPDARSTGALGALRGRDPAFRATVEQAIKAAQTDCNVLIVGETGTGKDLLARLIHEASRRATDPFVAVNCGGIPRELIGSELFGHEKGAFTGAHADRDGYFVEAYGGTLFLDEIGELPIELQPHLLRVLESRRVRRIGGASERAVDVRIIAATNRLENLGTEASKLRLDLYHRLATVVLVLPPLRERMGDLSDLVQGMLAELAPEHGLKMLSDGAWKALAENRWPGNVRELRHAVVRASPSTSFPSSGWRGRRRSTTCQTPSRWCPTSACCAGRWSARSPRTARSAPRPATSACRSRRSPTARSAGGCCRASGRGCRTAATRAPRASNSD
jgi:transcriptional regulator with GAF, ATPase, and Fis domain